MHALRFPLAAGLGLFVALAVFTLLWMFVSRPIVVDPVAVAQDIKFTRQIVDSPIETRRRERIVRPPMHPSPAVPGIGATDKADVRAARPDATAVRYEPNVSADLDHYQRGATGQDRDVIPLVRIAPDYPPHELTLGTEGWVKVQFSIAPAGTVHDAFVVDSDPKEAFDAAALKAISRWRYNPKIESGVAVERVGVQTVIRFQLQR